MRCVILSLTFENSKRTTDQKRNRKAAKCYHVYISTWWSCLLFWIATARHGFIVIQSHGYFIVILFKYRLCNTDRWSRLVLIWIELPMYLQSDFLTRNSGKLSAQVSDGFTKEFSSSFAQYYSLCISTFDRRRVLVRIIPLHKQRTFILLTVYDQSETLSVYVLALLGTSFG